MNLRKFGTELKNKDLTRLEKPLGLKVILVDVANFLPSPHSLKNISTESH
jgi:hypothetical protein